MFSPFLYEVMLILHVTGQKCGHKIFQFMYFVKYFMQKVPNKCCPVKGVWLSFKHEILLLLGTLRPSEIYSLCLMTWKQVEVVSFCHLAHYDSSFLSFPPELKFSRDRCPIPRAADTGSVYCSPIWAKGSGPEWFWGAGNSTFPLPVWPSALWSEWRSASAPQPLGRAEAWMAAESGTLLCPSPGRILKNQQWRTFSRRMDGCVGVWVVLCWVSSPLIKNVSSPRFWPSVQACMSLCGFPAVSSHSSKNVHTEKLPSGCECLCCKELDLMPQCK